LCQSLGEKNVNNIIDPLEKSCEKKGKNTEDRRRAEGSVRAGDFYRRVGDAPGPWATYTLRSSQWGTVLDHWINLSVPSRPCRPTTGQRHPLSLQRFTTLRDYFKKLGGARWASALPVAAVASRQSHVSAKYFYAAYVRLVKRIGILSALLSLSLSTPDIVGAGRTLRTVYLLKYAEQPVKCRKCQICAILTIVATANKDDGSRNFFFFFKGALIKVWRNLWLD